MRVYELCRTPENVSCPAHRWVQNVQLAFSVVLGAEFASAVGSASDCRSRGREFERHVGHITFVETDYEIISRTDSNRTDSNFQTKVSTNQTTVGTEMRWCVLGSTSFWTDYSLTKTFFTFMRHICTISMSVSKLDKPMKRKYEIILRHFGPELLIFSYHMQVWELFQTFHWFYLSRDMTKQTKWVCAQRRLRWAWAST